MLYIRSISFYIVILRIEYFSTTRVFFSLSSIKLIFKLSNSLILLKLATFLKALTKLGSSLILSSKFLYKLFNLESVYIFLANLEYISNIRFRIREYIIYLFR